VPAAEVIVFVVEVAEPVVEAVVEPVVVIEIVPVAEGVEPHWSHLISW